MIIQYPIFLIGYMSSGKTSLGKKLAQHLQIAFYDLDQTIEQKEKRTVSELFKEEGEAYFREVEAKALREFRKGTEAVIALGGGTPCHHQNMDYIKDNGCSIFLDLAVETIIGRLKTKKVKRPLIAQLTDDELSSFVKDHWQKRLPVYHQAEHILSTSSKPKIDELLKVLSLKE